MPYTLSDGVVRRLSKTQKNVTLSVRLTLDEKHALTAIAHTHNTTPSAVIHAIVADALGAAVTP